MLCAASVRALLPSSAFLLPDCAACVRAPPVLGEGICDFYCQNGSFQIYLPALVQFYRLVQCMRLLWPLCPWLPSGLCGPFLWFFCFVFCLPAVIRGEPSWQYLNIHAWSKLSLANWELEKQSWSSAASRVLLPRTPGFALLVPSAASAFPLPCLPQLCPAVASGNKWVTAAVSWIFILTGLTV